MEKYYNIVTHQILKNPLKFMRVHHRISFDAHDYQLLWLFSPFIKLHTDW